MADFCQQCSIEIFGEDHRDLADLGRGKKAAEGWGWIAICEGCGSTLVNDEGRCVYQHCSKHGAKNEQDTQNGS